MKKTFLFLLGALAVCSCSKSVPVDQPVKADDQAIGFSAFTHRATNTKGTIDDLASIEAAGRQYVMRAFQMATVFPDAGSTARQYFSADFGFGINTSYPDTWNTASTYYWPKETVTDGNGAVAINALSFFTYGPSDADITFDANGYSGEVERLYPCLDVTVADENAEQQDILAAMTEFRTYTVPGAAMGAEANKVNIDYNHILSAVTFLANTKDSVVFRVREIKVGLNPLDTANITAALYPSGRYGFEADNERGLWSGISGDLKTYGVGLAGTDGYVVVDSTDNSADVRINADDQILMLIPQPIEEEKAYFSVTYDVYDKDNVNPLDTAITKYAPLFATNLHEWATGKKYNYIFTLRKDVRYPIEYIVQVEGWEEQDVIEQFEGQYTSDRDLPHYEDGGDEFDREW